MNETQIIKLFFSIFLSVGSAFLLLIVFKLYYNIWCRRRSVPQKRSEPKLSYVLRYSDRKWAFWLTFLSACAVLITDLLLLILLQKESALKQKAFLTAATVG